MFGWSKSYDKQSRESIHKPEENEGMRILLDFKLSGATVAKVAIAVISAAAVSLMTTVVIQAMRSPTTTTVENSHSPK